MADNERASIRITGLGTETSPSVNDYAALDHEVKGTRKVSFPNLTDKVLDGLGEKIFTIPDTGRNTIPSFLRILNQKINNITAPDGQPTLSELVDIRTNFLGQVFDSAGDAVRISDSLISGYNVLPYTSEVIESGSLVEVSAGFINVSNYKGGKIIVTTIAGPTLLPLSGQSGIGVNNSPTATGGFFLENDSKTGATHPVSNYLDDYNEVVLATYGNDDQLAKLLVSFSIPSDFAYDYIGIAYISQTFSGTTVPWNYYLPYGLNIGKLTFTDPSSDGNIIIS